MPWHREATKDVVGCDKLRRAAKQAKTRRFLNGETHRLRSVSPVEHIGRLKQTRGSDTSQYPEEKKTIVILLVAASERGRA